MLGPMLVFVPLTPADLGAWARSGVRDVAGFTATPAFLEAFGLSTPDDEDAALTLLEVAALAGLSAHGVRLVAVCETDAAAPAEPADFGAVHAASVSWSRVTSIFADDADGAARASAAAAHLRGLDLAAAWETDEAGALLAATDLLWHSSTEWDGLSH